MIITTRPSIQYYDPAKNTLKLRGEIPLSANIHVTVKGKTFQIVTPNRTYNFKEISDTPERWVAAVKKIAFDYHRLNLN